MLHMSTLRMLSPVAKHGLIMQEIAGSNPHRFLFESIQYVQACTCTYKYVPVCTKSIQSVLVCTYMHQYILLHTISFSARYLS